MRSRQNVVAPNKTSALLFAFRIFKVMCGDVEDVQHILSIHIWRRLGWADDFEWQKVNNELICVSLITNESDAKIIWMKETLTNDDQDPLIITNGEESAIALKFNYEIEKIVSVDE
jgi:hypothetical protein